jgi:regulator of ribonuclease activity A
VKGAKTVNTADLCDRYWPNLALCTAQFRSFGRRQTFHGPVETVQVFEDNVLVKEAIESVAAGTVLVVDGGGSLRCALVGGNLAATAARRALAGIIVYGCVRDVVELAVLDVGILALGACPVRSEKKRTGARGVPLRFGGVEWRPGMYVYADPDGVIVSPVPLADGE